MGGLQFLLTKTVLWLSFNVMVISAGQATKVCTERSRIHKQGVCGASIPKVLSALCGKSGYVEKVYKRSESSPTLAHIAGWYHYLLRVSRFANFEDFFVVVCLFVICTYLMFCITFEPANDKMMCAPSEDSDQPRHLPGQMTRLI